MNIIDSGKLHSAVKDKFQFLTVPLNVKADFTESYHYLYHNDGEFVSTDGHRLHIVKDENLPEFEQGFYKIIKKNKSSFLFIKEDKELHFPDYKLVIPKDEPKVGSSCSNYIATLTFIIRNVSEKNTINPDYVKDLFSFEHNYWTINIYDKMVMFENGETTALIMLIKQK